MSNNAHYVVFVGGMRRTSQPSFSGEEERGCRINVLPSASPTACLRLQSSTSQFEPISSTHSSVTSAVEYHDISCQFFCQTTTAHSLPWKRFSTIYQDNHHRGQDRIQACIFMVQMCLSVETVPEVLPLTHGLNGYHALLTIDAESTYTPSIPRTTAMHGRQLHNKPTPSTSHTYSTDGGLQWVRSKRHDWVRSPTKGADDFAQGSSLSRHTSAVERKVTLAREASDTMVLQ